MPGTGDVEMRQAIIKMSTNDSLWKQMEDQVKIFLGKLVTGKARDDKFISRHSEKVLWQSVYGVQGKLFAEIGRKEFLDAVNEYFLLKEKGNFSGSMPFLLKALLRFEEQNFKYCRLVSASEYYHCQLHNNLG